VLALIGIYLFGLAVALLAGLALRGLLDPGARWMGLGTLPLGVCTLIVLLYPLGAALPGSQAAPVALALVLAGGGAAVVRLRRATLAGARLEALRAAVRPTGPEAVILAAGLVAGLLLLIPTMLEGLPTTIAVSNYDGWAYATLVDWLVDHPFPRDVANLGPAEPLTLVPATTMDRSFAFGFEHFAALVAALLGRDGYEVINAAAAVCFAASLGGWAVLAAALRPRLGPLGAGLIALAAATPLAVLAFADNFVTQFVSICIWPFALGAFAEYARRRSWRELVVAGVAGAGLVGVYPAMVPWIVLPCLAVAVLAPPRAERSSWGWLALPGEGARDRTRRAAVLAGGLLAAVMVLGPIQVARVIPNLRFLDTTVIAGLYTDFAPGVGYASFFLGGSSASSLLSGSAVAWSVVAALLLLVGAFAVAFAAQRLSRAGRLALVAAAAGVLLTTGVAALRYTAIDPQPYQVFKGLILGGAVFAGLGVVALLPGGAPRRLGATLAGLGLMAAVWIPVSSQTLQESYESVRGFRPPDVEMGRALEALPPGATVLAEGAAPDADSSQLEMMAAYFADRAGGLPMEGLGNTSSFLSPGGEPDWRPSRPWTHVLATGPQPVATLRVPLWANSDYRLAAAPALDVTAYGRGWYPPEGTGRGVSAWTAYGTELLVSNRDDRPRRARLSMEVASYAQPRTLELGVGGRTIARPLAADVGTPVALVLAVPARSVAIVTLDATPGATTAPDGRALMLLVSRIRVAPA
jgi:hypothetical protein